MRGRALPFAVLMAALGFGACSDAAEGESCDLANGNDDCEQGLVCRGPWEVSSSEAVCCPAPPAKPGVSACQPKVKKDHEPDPSVDAAVIPPGTGGTAGAAGSGGAAGSDGSAGADSGDAAQEASSDAPAEASGDAAAD